MFVCALLVCKNWLCDKHVCVVYVCVCAWGEGYWLHNMYTYSPVHKVYHATIPLYPCTCTHTQTHNLKSFTHACTCTYTHPFSPRTCTRAHTHTYSTVHNISPLPTHMYTHITSPVQTCKPLTIAVAPSSSST